MSTVSNVNGQLEIISNNKREYYQFNQLSNLTWVLNNDGQYYVHFTFESDYFVKIKLSDVTNQLFWGNTQPGADQAVADIASWIGSSSTSAPIPVTPGFMRVSNAATLSNSIIYSLSVSNVGTANGYFLGTILKPGETLNFSAGEGEGYFPDPTFSWDATGTEFIIIYTAP
jgi:hypothetical protein